MFRAILLVSAILGAAALAAEKPPRLDNLLIYGDGFVFSAKEPQGWVGDTTNSSAWGCNVLFYPRGQTPQEATIIRVRVNPKTDEATLKDLEFDMEGYRREYPEVAFEDLHVPHPRYRSVPKLFYVTDKFYEYVTYLNPGVEGSLLFSVSMNKPHARATAAELAAFRSVVASLTLMTAKPNKAMESEAKKARGSSPGR